jgi:hypothetical protein
VQSAQCRDEIGCHGHGEKLRETSPYWIEKIVEKGVCSSAILVKGNLRNSVLCQDA